MGFRFTRTALPIAEPIGMRPTLFALAAGLALAALILAAAGRSLRDVGSG